MSQQQNQKTKRGKTIGDYIIGRKIGTATFATVRQGIHQRTGERVSIKILNKNLIEEAKDKINVSRELRILRKVRHPHIAQLLQTMETNTKIYLVMELAEGGQLFNMITQNKKGRITQGTASTIFQQLINAIEYLHKIGVAHRDIKPENILLDHQGHIKLIDFGLSSFYQKNQKLMTSCGSPCYAAPEMLVEEAYNPLFADLWSCGIVLYAMVCGFLPYQDRNTKILYEKIEEGIYDEPKHMSLVVKDLISKILRLKPEERIKIQQIRKHPFCQPKVPLIKGLLPSQSLKIDDEIVKIMNQLGYHGFRTDVENHRNSQNTAAYYLLLYKELRKKKISLIAYFQTMIQEQKISSPFRSKSLVLKRQISEDLNKKNRKILAQNEEEIKFLEQIFAKNLKKMKERSLNIRIRKVTS